MPAAGAVRSRVRPTAPAEPSFFTDDLGAGDRSAAPRDYGAGSLQQLDDGDSVSESDWSPARPAAASRGRRGSTQIDFQRWGIFGAVGVGVVVVLVMVVSFGSKLFKSVAGKITAEINATSQPAVYLPADWTMAMHVRVAELVDGRLDRLPQLKAAFEEPIGRARSLDVDPKTIDDMFITIDAKDQVGCIVIVFNKPIFLKPGQEEFYHGEKIVYRKDGNTDEYQVRPNSRLLIATTSLERLKLLIDQAARGESHPIDFPSGCQIAMRMQNLDSALGSGPWSFGPGAASQPGGMGAAGGSGSAGFKGLSMGLSIANRVEIQAVVDTNDEASARQAVQEFEVQTQSTKDFLEACKTLNPSSPDPQQEQMLAALKNSTCVAAGIQVRINMAFEIDAMNALVGGGAAGGPFAGMPNLGGFGGAQGQSPPSPVTITLAGVKDNDAQQRIIEKLRSLTDTVPGNYQAKANHKVETAIVQIGPVSDPAGFAKRIEFGKVMGPNGRRMTVQVDAALVAQLAPPPAQPSPSQASRRRPPGSPPPDSKTLMEELDSSSFVTRRDAAQALAKLKPDENQSAVARRLESALQDNDKSLVEYALDALAAWGDKDSAIPVKQVLRSASWPSTKSKALTILVKFPDEDLVDVVAEAAGDLRGSGGDARAILEQMGPSGEKAAIKILTGSKAWVFTKRDVAKFMETFSKKHSLSPESIAALLDLVRDDHDHDTVRPLIAALATVKEERVADFLATGLGDFWYAKDAKAALIAMGPAAEKSVAKYLKHQKPEVRFTCCEILAVIGTKKSVSALRPLVANNPVGQAAKEAIDTINQRAKQEN